MLSKAFKAPATSLKRFFSTRKVVTLKYSDLLAPTEHLNEKIAEAYGPDGYGLLLVENIPQYTEVRSRLLHLNYELANLPPQKIERLVRKEDNYEVGFSRGVEKFKGKPDFSKGSYYANPQYDEPLRDPQNPQKILVPGNVWPREDLPEYEQAFKNLGRLIVDVGIKLTGVVDRYVEKNMDGYEKGKLRRIISESKICKARGLYYYPMTEKMESEDNWCGWHNDHGTLTGLCSAMYHDSNGKQVTVKDENTGLFVQTRDKKVVRVAIPSDQLAFQIGESAQIHTGGLLSATPHSVRIGEKLVGTGISRSTMAVFMQPNFNEQMVPPNEKITQEHLENTTTLIPTLKERFTIGDTFLKFHNRTCLAYLAGN